MNTEIENELASLPPGFFGVVEITYQNGVPGLIRVTKTRKLSNPNGKTLGERNELTRK